MADVTYYVALPFGIGEDGPEPCEANECISASAAIRSAERMARTERHIGAVAFSRTGNPGSGEFADAVSLDAFGEVPSELSALKQLKYGMKLPPSKHPIDPSFEQTEEQITAYYKNAQAGDCAAIRTTHGGWLTFKITTVSDSNANRSRVYLADAPSWGGLAFHIKSGKNCVAPAGRSSIVIPTDSVKEWAKEHPQGTRDWSSGYASASEILMGKRRPRDD